MKFATFTRCIRAAKRTVERIDSKSILGRAVHRCSSDSSRSAAVYVLSLCVAGAAAATAVMAMVAILLLRPWRFSCAI